MYASLSSSTDRDITFEARVRNEAEEDKPARHIVHVHAAYGPYLALSVLEARRLVEALTGALEEHDATRELDLSIARREARQRIGAGE